MNQKEWINESQIVMEFEDYPGMVRRPAWMPNPGIASQPVDWQKLLTLKDLYCVIGNQLISHVQTYGDAWPKNHSLGVGHTKNEGFHYTSGKVEPGLEYVEFYPLAKGNVHGGEMDVLPAALSFFDTEGGSVEFSNDMESRKWRPDLQEDVFKAGNNSFVQRIACGEDIIICRITPLQGDFPAYFEISCDFGGTRGLLEVEASDGQTFIWGQEKDWSNTVFGLWCNKPLEAIETSEPGDPVNYKLRGACGEELVIAYSAAYLMGDLKARMKEGLKCPKRIFEKATGFWNEYFTGMVPYFDCSDISYVKQYYYTFFCLRANVWDVPYKPLLYPYTCTSKLIWKWSWPWNSIFDNATLRWLNDKSLAEGNVLLEFFLGRSMMEDPCAFGFPDMLPREDANALPIAYGSISSNTTIYDAIWMTYLVSNNRDWLKKLYPAIKKHYYEMLGRCNPEGLAGWGLDEWDMTARVQAFNPDTMIDASCFFASCSESLSRMADVLGFVEEREEFGKRAAELRRKIQTKLWDNGRKIFVDANVEKGTFSHIKTAASFDPLYCGAATKEQAEHLVKHLTDPDEFWTAYPIPAFSIDTPEFSPDAENIGNGPIPPISCGWFQIQGLANYGYTEIAAELIRRQMRMNTLHGVSSAVKFNPITGEGLQFFVSRKEDHSLCTMNATIVDLVIRFVVGFQPREDDLIEFNPIALDFNSWKSLEWGPFRYRNMIVSMMWSYDKGMVVKCNDSTFSTPLTQRVILRYDGKKLIEV